MPQDPLIGQTLGGNFTLLELIGTGGMGRVYLAEQLSLERKVAVKVLHPHLAEQPLFVRRFWTEARAASRIMHPGCAAILHFGVEGVRPFLVMEHLRGRSLARALADGPPPTPAQACEIALQVLDVLVEAHALGVVHRDLKPDNVFLAEKRDGGEAVKVLDFGIARLMSSADRRGPSEPGQSSGTPTYMSPEQAAGQTVDGRSDLYSLGAVLFEMLTGRPPFVADQPLALLLQHLTHPPPDPRAIAPHRGLPEPLCALVTAALAKQPEQRFDSAAAMRDALVDVALSLPAPSRKTPPPPPPPPLVAPPAVTTQEALGRGLRAALEQLERHLASGPWALLSGKPGSGKTAIVTELEARIEARGERVARAAAHPSQAPVCYFPLVTMVERLTGQAPRALVAGGKLELAPLERAGLAELVSPSGLLGLPAVSRAPAVAAALAALVKRASGGRPVWLLLDEAEAYDHLSLEALALLGRSAPAELRLVIASSSLPRALREAPRVTLPDGSDPGWAPLCAELAWAYGPLPVEGVPPLVELVLLHLERLGPRARELAAVASVLGGHAPRAALLALCPEAGPDARADLERSKLARADGEGGLRVPRAIGRVIEASLPSEARRQLHARARAFWADHGAPLEVLAEHAHQGNEPVMALALLSLAGEEASRRGDHQGACVAFGKRLELARAELLLRAEPLFEQAVARAGRDLAQALLDAGRPAEGAGLLRELAGLDASPGERAVRALLEARCLRARGRADEAMAKLDEALLMPGEASPLSHRTHALIEKAALSLELGRKPAALEALEQLSGLLAERLVPRDIAPLGWLRLGQLRAAASHPRASLDLERALLLARLDGAALVEAEALATLASLAAEKESDEASALREQAQRLWAEAGARLPAPLAPPAPSASYPPPPSQPRPHDLWAGPAYVS